MDYGLYVFSSDFGDGAEPEELAECDVGEFCDLAFFHSSIDCNLGDGRHPTLMRLLDSDDRFPASEVRELERELQEIAAAFRELPSERMTIAFERVAEARARQPGRFARAAQERFHDPYACITSFECSLDYIGPFRRELREIAAEFHKLPSEETREPRSGTSKDGGGAGSLYDCFRNANGENLFECLLELCAVAIEHDRPIIFRNVARRRSAG